MLQGGDFVGFAFCHLRSTTTQVYGFHLVGAERESGQVRTIKQIGAVIHIREA